MQRKNTSPQLSSFSLIKQTRHSARSLFQPTVGIFILTNGYTGYLIFAVRDNATPHARARAHTHTRTHTYTHARTHHAPRTHAHTHTIKLVKECKVITPSRGTTYLVSRGLFSHTLKLHVTHRQSIPLGSDSVSIAECNSGTIQKLPIWSQ